MKVLIKREVGEVREIRKMKKEEMEIRENKKRNRGRGAGAREKPAEQGRKRGSKVLSAEAA